MEYHEIQQMALAELAGEVIQESERLRITQLIELEERLESLDIELEVVHVD